MGENDGLKYTIFPRYTLM